LKDKIINDASSLGINNEEELSQDSDRWRQVVVAAIDPNDS